MALLTALDKVVDWTQSREDPFPGSEPIRAYEGRTPAFETLARLNRNVTEQARRLVW